MCGIAAVFGYSSSAAAVNQGELLRIREAMINRGPDGAGLWISDDTRVGLAHRRLAIIDLTTTGTQPMAAAEGRFRVVFNGEIYNYRELRQRLEAKGYRFRSHSDTEVLLHLYQEYGRDMFQHLRGMYSFALWDEVNRGLLLARDPFGIKPLYYADNGSSIRVASQVKALLAGGGIDTRPEPAGHVGFQMWGHVPEPYTLYKGIRSLPAGSFLWVDSSGHKERRQFFRIADEISGASLNSLSIAREEMRARLRTGLLDSVRHHLIADVPIGIFLSAGIDSTTLLAFAKEAGLRDLHTVTIGFREYQGTPADEVPLAEITARHYGTTQHTSWVARDDFHNEYQHLLGSMDQPSVDGVNSYFASKAAKEAGLKVVLSGLGGDELFGGYSNFHQIPRMVGVLGPFNRLPAIGRSVRRISSPILRRFTSHKYAGLLEYGGTYGGAYLLRRALNMPWALPEILDEDMVAAGLKELGTLPHLNASVQGTNISRLKVAALETSWYMRNQLLRDTDWASMAHSVEIRVPLVDIELFRATVPLYASPHPPTKLDLAQAPTLPLPGEILSRGKTGFPIPVREWSIQNDGSSAHSRGLRGWAMQIYRAFTGNVIPGSGTAPRTLLVFRIGQLGDTLVALPAIEAIRRKYPNHRLVLLTDRQVAGDGYVSSWEVLGPTGWFDRVIYYDPKASGQNKILSLIPLFSQLRALKADHVFNLAPDRSAWQRTRDKIFFHLMVGAQDYHAPAPLRRIRLIADAGLPKLEPEWLNIHRSVAGEVPAGYEFHLPVPEIERDRAYSLAKGAGIDLSARLLAVGAGSKMSAKKWPVERYVELGTRLMTEFPNLRLVVLGGKEDMGVAHNLCAAWGQKQAYSLAGKLSAYGSAAILKRCVAYVGNDTGTMHLAGMAGIPCVGIFSARDYPGKWEPYGKGHIVLRKDIECAGCMLQECAQYDNQCLKLIGVDEVCAAVRSLIGSMDVVSSIDHGG